MKTAVVFPGQGSQIVGMGSDLANTSAAHYFNEADDSLCYKLSAIMFEGPETKLKLTENTQPALLVHSLALWSMICDKVQPDYFAGHSLGEYTAVTAAGGFSYKEAVKAVHNRGRFMQQAIPLGIGGMAAILGANSAGVEAVCSEVSTETSVVEPANYNCEGQIVVSGHLTAIDRLSFMLTDRKLAKRVIRLAVSAPFHSSLMEPAAKQMENYLKDVSISDLNTTVINNVDVCEECGAGAVKDALIRQITGSVKWHQTVEKLKNLGVTRYIEVGSGQVLTGLIKKIDRSAECINVSNVEDITNLRGRLS